MTRSAVRAAARATERASVRSTLQTTGRAVRALARLLAAALACAVLGATPAALAHPLDPALLELRESAPGVLDVSWKTARAAQGVLEPVLPDDCRDTSERRARVQRRSVLWRWSVTCEAGGLVGREVGVRGLAARQGDALLRIELADGRRVQAVLRADAPLFTVPERAGPLDVFADYLLLGIEHIAGGLDHLAFVLGLVLLVRGRRALLWTITAFTVGHSVTLTLATLGFVRFPQAVAEAAIALSIVLLAAEILRDDAAAREATSSARTSWIRRRPWSVAFAFGLLHGLGFAGALSETGLPDADVPLALLSFNLGIELGQLAFVAALLVVAATLRPWLVRLPSTALRIPAYAVGTLGAYWLVARSETLLGMVLRI